MSEVVLKGILEAQKELEKENENKLLEEGVLRQVPLVASFINWWSPPPKDSVVKGRSLNLTSGSLESTEKTYKLHMQVQEETASPVRRPAAKPRSSPRSDGASPQALAPHHDDDDDNEEKPIQKRDLEGGVESKAAAPPTVESSETPEKDTSALDAGDNEAAISDENATSGSSFQEVSSIEAKDLTTESEGEDLK